MMDHGWSPRQRAKLIRFLIPFAVTATAIAGPVRAESDLEKGFGGALRGCEEWVLNPATWARGLEPFVSAVGLGDKMGLVDRIEEIALPPEPLRVANHYWRINSTIGAGFILIVSDRLPMCHITGGGNADLQPVVAAVLASSDFATRWELLKAETKGDMASSVFRNRKDPALSIVISRAKALGLSRDRVQVIATATYEMKK